MQPYLLACRFMLPRHLGRRCHVTLPYASLSCTKIESPQIRRKLFAFRDRVLLPFRSLQRPSRRSAPRPCSDTRRR